MSDLFKKRHTRTAALIHVTPESIGMGYSAYRDGERPCIAYISRTPIETKPDVPLEATAIDTMSEAGMSLVKDGAPMLLRTAGTGKADAVFVSISTPWQETRVSVETIDEPSPFLFTQEHMRDLLQRVATPAPQRIIADTSPTDISINGYHVENPYGKPAEHVSVTILTSSVAEHFSQEIASGIRSLLHTTNVFFIAGSSLIFQAVRAAFPHERDYLILDAETADVSIALVRAGTIVAVSHVKDVIENEVHWPQEVHIALKKIGQGFPLPHNVIMIGSEQRYAALVRTLQNSAMTALWLSKDAPSIRLLGTEHLSPHVRQTFEGAPDLSLALMALYAERV